MKVGDRIVERIYGEFLYGFYRIKKLNNERVVLEELEDVHKKVFPKTDCTEYVYEHVHVRLTNKVINTFTIDICYFNHYELYNKKEIYKMIVRKGNSYKVKVGDILLRRTNTNYEFNAFYRLIEINSSFILEKLTNKVFENIILSPHEFYLNYELYDYERYKTVFPSTINICI